MSIAIGVMILAVILVLGTYGHIHSSHDNWDVSTYNRLDPEAIVISVETRRYNKYKFQTEVKFDDGFVYRSYDTQNESVGFNKKRIYVTPSMKESIIRTAIYKHQELLNKQDVKPDEEKAGAKQEFGTTGPVGNSAAGQNNASCKVEKTSVMTATCVSGNAKGKTAAGKVIYIGRDPQLCQLVYPHNALEVARIHCMLHDNNGTIELRDMKALNGIVLENGRKLAPDETVSMRNGDAFYLGSRNNKVVVRYI